MFLRRRSDTRTTRGQAMVEFALMLPILALLLVFAIDFGRVFFGKVALNNAARIGANDAGVNPDAWSENDADAQNRYRDRIEADLQAINCEYQDPLPDPVFTDRVGSAGAYDIGDHVTVTLTCQFDLLTPIAGGIVGSPLQMSSEATFAIRGGVIEGTPIGPQPPPPSCSDPLVPNLVGLSVSGARTSWTNAGYTGAFSPATGSDTDTVTMQSTTPPSDPGDCLSATASVTVTHDPPAGCSGTEQTVPNLLGQALADARDTWTDAGFAGNFSPATGFDTEIVLTQTTSTADDPGDCAEPDTTVTVTHGTPPPPPDPKCPAPDLFGQKVNSINDSDFDPNWTGDLIITRPPQGNYSVGNQSLVAGEEYDCDVDMTVFGS